MQNEFEKNVQKKMDELKFQPSAPVWEGVEAAIREKRKRRRILFLLPLLLLLGLGGSILINGVDKDQTAKGTSENTTSETGVELKEKGEVVKGREKVESEELIKLTDAEDGGENGESIGRETGTKTERETEKAESSPTLEAGNTEPGAPVAKRKNSTRPLKRSERNNEAEAVARIENKANPTENPSAVSEKKESKRNEIGNAEGFESKESQKLSRESRADEPILSKEGELIDKPLPDSSKKTDTTKLPALVKESRKWNFGITGGVGFSSESAGLQLGMEKAEFGYIPTNQSPGTGGIGAGSGQIPQAGSPINKALHLSLGFSAENQLSNKLFLNLGLQYSFFSNYRQVGNYILDSVTGTNRDGYYANSGNRVNTASNHFHFISLPVNLRWSLSERFSLEGGGGAAFLVNSKAYTFSPFDNGYYTTDQVNKVQGFVNLGLSYSLVKKGSRELRIGPSLQYNLSNWTGNETGRHLYSASITAKYFFN